MSDLDLFCASLEDRPGMGRHHTRDQKTKDEWLTPPELVEMLGPFDLDPCAPIVRPWNTAAQHYTIEDNGLLQPWSGRVWLNPPYGRALDRWLARLAAHGDGIALIFARTDTAVFQRLIFGRADAILFLSGRLHFHHVDGRRASANAGAPSCLAAFGNGAAERLCGAAIEGWRWRRAAEDQTESAP